MRSRSPSPAGRPPLRRRRAFRISAAWAAVAVALVTAGATTSWKFGLGGDSGRINTEPTPSTAPTFGTPVPTPSGSIIDNPVPTPTGLIREYADNHNGSPVFASTAGEPAPGELARIPFNTPIDVVCFAANASGMQSVSGFYLIGPDTKWKHLYVVADTMSNGGPPGNTTSPNVDPRVPPCP